MENKYKKYNPTHENGEKNIPLHTFKDFLEDCGYKVIFSKSNKNKLIVKNKKVFNINK